MFQHADRIANILLAAAHADRIVNELEQEEIRSQLTVILDMSELPPELEQRLFNYDSAAFDLSLAVRPFVDAPVRTRQALMKMVACVNVADGEITMEEAAFMERLSEILHLDDLFAQQQKEDLDRAWLRESFEYIALEDDD